jgi:hypothetical protein
MAIYEGIREQLLNTRDGKLTTHSSNQAGQWLHALPLPFAGLTMTPREYRTALHATERRKMQRAKTVFRTKRDIILRWTRPPYFET